MSGFPLKLVSWFHFFSSWFHNFVKLVSWFRFKNETSSRISKHETTKCNLQTAIYYGDFGILQKKKFFGFIFMKLEFRCTKSCIKFEFCFYMNETNQKFWVPLHRNRFRCNHFKAVFFFYSKFYSVSYIFTFFSSFIIW